MNADQLARPDRTALKKTYQILQFLARDNPLKNMDKIQKIRDKK